MNQSKPNVQQPVKASSGGTKPFEWMAQEARDHGADKLAEACDWLLSSRNAALEDASWQVGRRMQAEAECAKLRRYLQTIRDTGMTAEQAAEHAASALTTKANSE